jgi:hypothetical protein
VNSLPTGRRNRGGVRARAIRRHPGSFIGRQDNDPQTLPPACPPGAPQQPALAPGDVEHYLADLSRPGALTAGLNWYRANLAPQLELQRREPMPAVTAPTLGIWSTRDNYLTEHRMIRSGEHVTGPWRYERIEGASHRCDQHHTGPLGAGGTFASRCRRDGGKAG